MKQNKFHHFFASETGNVSVDWTLYASLGVAIGAALIASSKPAVQQSGTELQSDLWTNYDDEIVGNNTSGSAWDQQLAGFTTSGNTYGLGQTYFDLSDEAQASFEMNVNLSVGAEGILMDAGGSTGVIVYQHNGVLYVQAGDESGCPGQADCGEIAYTVAGGEQSVAVSIDSTRGMALYVDGALVGTTTLSNVRMAGPNRGGVGGSGRVPDNRGGFVAGDTYPGASNITIYAGEVTDDVP